MILDHIGRSAVMRIRFLLACVAVLVIAGAVAAGVPSAPHAAPRFITDAQGRALVLHGFSTDGGAKTSADGLPNIDEEGVEVEHEDLGTNFGTTHLLAAVIEPGQ